jgi:hypothetical protein
VIAFLAPAFGCDGDSALGSFRTFSFGFLMNIFILGGIDGWAAPGGARADPKTS